MFGTAPALFVLVEVSLRCLGEGELADTGKSGGLFGSPFADKGSMRSAKSWRAERARSRASFKLKSAAEPRPSQCFWSLSW